MLARGEGGEGFEEGCFVDYEVAVLGHVVDPRGVVERPEDENEFVDIGCQPVAFMQQPAYFGERSDAWRYLGGTGIGEGCAGGDIAVYFDQRRSGECRGNMWRRCVAHFYRYDGGLVFGAADTQKVGRNMGRHANSEVLQGDLDNHEQRVFFRRAEEDASCSFPFAFGDGYFRAFL